LTAPPTSSSGYQSHATFSAKASRQNQSFGGRLVADCVQNLPEKVKPCSSPLVKSIVLLLVCAAGSLNILALFFRLSGFSTAIRMHE